MRSKFFGGIFAAASLVGPAACATAPEGQGPAYMPAGSFPERDEGTPERLEAWFDRYGIKHEAVNIAPSDLGPRGSLGVFAAWGISKGETIASIPITSTLGPKDITATVLDGLDAFAMQNPAHDIVSLSLLLSWLLFDPEGAASDVGQRYAPYLASLPDASHLPTVWSEAERRAAEVYLPPPPFTADRYEDLRATLVGALGSLTVSDETGELRSCFGRNETLNAFATVVARSRSVPIVAAQGAVASGVTGPLLIPIVDMFNHGADDQSPEIFARFGTIHVVARRDYSEGEEITIQYDANGRGGLMIASKYGFVPEFEISDSALLVHKSTSVPFDPALALPYADPALSHIDNEDWSKSSFGTVVSALTLNKTMPFMRMLALLKHNEELVKAGGERFSVLAAKAFCAGAFDPNKGCGISRTNENQALAALTDTLEMLIATYSAQSNDDFLKVVRARADPVREEVIDFSLDLRRRTAEIFTAGAAAVKTWKQAGRGE